jgi:hypothetical protein
MIAQTSETEHERQRLVDELAAEHGSDWSKPYEPGSFGCHELLDRTSLVAGLVERYLLSHPACVHNPEWYDLADRAATALRDLYQQIGQAHMEEQTKGADS